VFATDSRVLSHVAGFTFDPTSWALPVAFTLCIERAHIHAV